MKICLVGNSNSIHLQRWSRWFVQRGYDVHLITTGTTKIEGVTIYHLKKTRGPINYFLRIIKTIRIIRRLKPQVINAHFVSSTETFAAALSHYYPFVVSAWGSDIIRDPGKSRVLKTEIKYVLKHADIVHTGDQFGKERLLQLGCADHKIAIVPWGVDVEQFDEKQPAKKPNKFVVISGNQWEPYHHIDIFIKAIPRVVKEIKDITFLLLGGGSQEEELKTLTKTLEIEQYVYFVGRVPHEEIPTYLSLSDILVDTDIPGDNAGAGIGLLNMEAMVCGVPILLSERGYMKKIGKSLCDESWYCGIVYEPGNSNDLGEKILKLLKDDSLRKTISEKEKKIAREIGDWNKNMEKMEQIMLNQRL